MAPGRGQSSAAPIVEYTTARGCHRAIPASAATRAAWAQARSVSASVRTCRRRAAATTSTCAPARRSAPAKAASEARRPAVEPSDTRRTWARAATSTGGVAVGRDPRQIPTEPRRAQELDRAQRRRLLDVERDAVAVLDGGHGAVLAAPRERPDHREARGDPGDLRREEREADAEHRRQRERPQPVD